MVMVTVIFNLDGWVWRRGKIQFSFGYGYGETHGKKRYLETLLGWAFDSKKYLNMFLFGFLKLWLKYVHLWSHFTQLYNVKLTGISSKIRLISDSPNLISGLIITFLSGYIYQEENKTLHTIWSGSKKAVS